MPPAVDLKRRIVDLRGKGFTTHDITARLGVSVGGVHRILCTYEEYGEYTKGRAASDLG